MSIDIGITGPAGSGKTTIFNALTRGKADTESVTPHIGIAEVPEPRLKMLADILHPKRVVPAEVRYIDTGAPIKDKAISGQLLSHLSNADALINVVRALTNENKPYIEAVPEIEHDIAAINAELAFSDLALLERRLERIKTSLRGAKQPEHQSLLREEELLMKVKADLEKDMPIRELSLTTDEVRTIANYQFLTAKPLLIMVNIDEDQLPQALSLEAELNSHYSRPMPPYYPLW